MIGLEILLGGLTGYFTNDIAIHQLFSKNGIVVREREEFTELLVRVLKEKILDENLMKKICENESVISLFQTHVKDFFSRALPKILEKYPVNEIEGAEDALAIIQKHFKEFIDNELNFDEQYIVSRVDEIIHSDDWHMALERFAEAIGQLSFEQIGLLDGLIKDLNHAMVDDHTWTALLSRIQSFLKMAIHASKHEINIKLNLAEVFSINSNEAHNELEKYAFDKLTSLDDKEFLILQEAIYCFFEQHLQEMLSSFFDEGIHYLKEWMLKDHEAIKQMVLRTMELGLKEEDNLIVSTFKRMIKQFFEDNENERWVEQLFHLVEDETYRQRLCKKMSDFIQGFILNLLDQWRQCRQNGKVFSPELIRLYLKLRSSILNVFGIFWTRTYVISEQHLQKVLDVIPTIFSKGQVKTIIVRHLKQVCEKWRYKTLNMMIPQEDITQVLKKTLHNLWENQGKTLVHQYIANKAPMKSFFSQSFEENENLNLGKIICYATTENEKQLGDFLRKKVFENLPDFVGQLAKKQLDAMDEEQLRQLILQMLGKEMKPLSVIGGIVGLLAGFVTGASMQMLTPEQSMQLSEGALAVTMAGRSLAYGGVGYATNVMAIKGLFWPYQKKFGVQGLLSANQERFANKMRGLTAEYIVNGTIWQQTAFNASSISIEQKKAYLEYFRQDGIRKLEMLDEDSIEVYLKRMLKYLLQSRRVKESTQKFVENNHELILKKIVLQDDLVKYSVNNLFEKALRYLKKDSLLIRMLINHFHSFSGNLEIEAFQHKINTFLGNLKLPEERERYKGIVQVFASSAEIITEKIKGHQAAIEESLNRFIYDRLPFPLQLGYKIANGDYYIKKMVDYFLKEELPQYVSDKYFGLVELATQIVYQSLSKQPLTEVGILLSKDESSRLLSFTNWVNEEDFKVIGQSVLNALDIDKLIYNDSLMQSQYIIAKKCFSNMASLSEVQDVFKDIIFSGTLLQYDRHIWSLAQCFLNKFGIIKAIGGRETVAKGMDSMIRMEKFEQEMISEYLLHLWTHYEKDILDEMIFWGEAFFEIIDIPEITYQQVMNLSPQELEYLVRDIAQPYFSHVERMGWYGALVAVPATALSMYLS